MSLSIGTRSMRAILGEGNDLSDHAHNRLLTVEVSPDRRYGLFDALPDAFSSASACAAAVRGSVIANHGVALPEFLRQLIRERVADEPRLRRRLIRLVTTFRRKCKVDLNDQSAVQAADAFGLLFAAGRLAKGYGILPDDWKVGSSMLSCYRARWQPAAPKGLVARLEEIAEKKSVIHIRRSEPAPPPSRVEAAKVLVKHKTTGRELFIRPNAIGSVLPDWKSQLGTPGTRDLMIRDGQHLTTKRRLAGKDVPVFCFTLPPEAAD